MNTKQANRRFHEEWYYCDFCDNQYPRQQVTVQNGRVRCHGPGTRNCVDKPGAAVYRDALKVPYESDPEPLPSTDEDL